MSNQADVPPPAYSAQQPQHASDSRPQQVQQVQQEEPLPLDSDGEAEMEDEQRPLPSGWVREYDPKAKHDFYVDTKSTPPRSIWVHPFFDEQFHSERPQDVPQEYRGMFDGNGPAAGAGPSQSRQQEHPGPQQQQSARKRWFGEKLKDKMTGTTHEQREEKREQRREQERQLYMIQLQRQKEYMERRRQMQAQMGYGRPMYAAPAYPYSRRGYGGMGGGMGMGLPLMGGLGAGMLLGGAMDGGFGGDFGGGGGDC